MEIEPITREEQLLNAVASGTSVNLEPITREEMFLAKAAGMTDSAPEPITRKEMFLSKISGGGGGGGSSGDDSMMECIVEAVSISGDLIRFGNFRDTQDFIDTFAGAILVVKTDHPRTHMLSMYPDANGTVLFHSYYFGYTVKSEQIEIVGGKATWKVDDYDSMDIGIGYKATVTYWKK